MENCLSLIFSEIGFVCSNFYYLKNPNFYQNELLLSFVFSTFFQSFFSVIRICFPENDNLNSRYINWFCRIPILSWQYFIFFNITQTDYLIVLMWLHVFALFLFWVGDLYDMKHFMYLLSSVPLKEIFTIFEIKSETITLKGNFIYYYYLFLYHIYAFIYFIEPKQKRLILYTIFDLYLFLFPGLFLFL